MGIIVIAELPVPITTNTNREYQQMYLLIYKTIHKNGKYYIGRHSTKNLNDGYFGSGKWVNSIKEKNNLTREILAEANSFDELCLLEEYYIELYWNDPLCMNYKKSSIGADFGENNPMFGRVGELNPMYHRKGELHPAYGKKYSKESCEKKSKSLKNKSYVELHGKEKAEEIKSKLRYPKTTEHKQKLKVSKSKVVCRLFDRKEMTLANFINWNNKKIRKGNTFYFYDINKNIIEINNLKTYCIINNLNYACMKDVNKGKQKSHKGYFRYEN